MNQQLIPRRKVRVPANPLKSMFKSQLKFQKRFYCFEQLTKQERTTYLFKMLTCINVEQVEALEWLTDPSWKDWKKKKTKFNRYEFINELVDIQHFLINCLLAVKCNETEFSKAFFNKNLENTKRQQKGN